jgi:hypothetical protein
MILTAHQPVYLPWLGLFHKVLLSDTYCIFDIAQYQTKDFVNRNKIKSSNGSHWLTVPVESKNHYEKRICDVKIINNGWNKKNFKSIVLAYSKTKYYKDYIDGIEDVLIGKSFDFLTDLNTELFKLFLKYLDINVPILKASDYDFVGSKSDLVLDMCIKLEAKSYIFGALGKDYADVTSFKNKGIEVFFQDYNHPVYNQQFKEFEPYMSVLDLLFNEGNQSREIITKNNVKNIKE